MGLQGGTVQLLPCGLEAAASTIYLESNILSQHSEGRKEWRDQSPSSLRRLISISCVPTDVLCASANVCARAHIWHGPALTAWPSVPQVSCQRAASFCVPLWQTIIHSARPCLSGSQQLVGRISNTAGKPGLSPGANELGGNSGRGNTGSGRGRHL